MAELSVHDVVDQSQSAGDLSPSDVPATTTNIPSIPAGYEASVDEVAQHENGIHTLNSIKLDELEDISGRSDTDTSRAEGSVASDKPIEARPLKKFAASKPVSFAKYSVPKVIAANAVAKGTDKTATTPSSSTSSLLQAGRPRLVAKTTISLQQKAKPFKTTTPDPMQVWNKNRVTPQTSTKHLTDEELKQQYGIHLTSRLQADGEGKEAKWADIDDDEDDWAPETIEWNDGTKTTLAASEITPAPAEKQPSELNLPDGSVSDDASRIRPPQFTTVVGPNATVLKLGASAERQQAQKAAAEKARSPLERSGSGLNSTAPAPTPSKSPWAVLPPVDKAAPIAINPQPMGPPPPRFSTGHGYAQSPSNMTAPSPATEISADDFNRAWKDAPSSQPQQLYMPNSGRYEAVPEGRRRMSKNDQNFRAPAVLQRPDGHTPAEPSAAFQTTRSSADVGRRRASSTISGGSGQLARRMSIKSGEFAPPVFDSQPRPTSQDGPAEPPQSPTNYHARASTSEASAGPVPPQYDIEAQREKQRAEMKQRIELARKRKEEEQAREEAEKQERIRQKLASLAPLPKSEKPESPSTLEPETHALADQDELRKLSDPAAASLSTVTSSPPKPPQPLATGAPQQYGMMKVHPLDTVTKLGSATQPPPLNRSRESEEAARLNPSGSATGRPSSDGRRQLAPESLGGTEPSPKLSKALSTGGDARNGWGDLSEHRSPAIGNLWGMPSNKALGNGTFDQGLAGYAPQDLSRTPSSAQGWMTNKTPTAGRSPQPHYLTQHVPENRAPLSPSLISPEATPLAIDSEADNLFPSIRPAPIGPPQIQAHPSQVNGSTTGQVNGTLAAWNNFHQVAHQQERAESEKFQRELAARREEELRTGVRQGPQYTLNETWKQVKVGDQAGERQVQKEVSSSAAATASSFGAVGQVPRGSRFFPQGPSGVPQPDRRAVTYSHPEISRSPSPPPAEEYGGYHPAYDRDSQHISIRLPPAKPIVNLPPALPPTPPSEIESVAIPYQAESPNLTWAARVSMPAPASTSSLRAVSTPIAQTPSWQERFNGLLGRKSSVSKTSPQLATALLAVTSSTREPLDVIAPVISAAVSLPPQGHVDSKDVGLVSSRDVEDEEDLFEDRELASLPTISFPLQGVVSLPLHDGTHHDGRGRYLAPVESSTVSHYHFVNNPNGRPPIAPVQFAIVRLTPGGTSIKRDLPQRNNVGPSNGIQKARIASQPMKKVFRGGKPRQPSKAH